MSSTLLYPIHKDDLQKNLKLAPTLTSPIKDLKIVIMLLLRVKIQRSKAPHHGDFMDLTFWTQN